eukprot:CAMPEP_0168529970 /NCGR_PEP_ID=MMETSP0405-20121227/14307_1 /TAXON_ID=498012 /ORGANISM="Trichosphaerium sp, Strain Am-I-7 wt" /LENGTH=302 /DNA_ID=CAMNT_0008553959 /DNA_START=341 /DNA_END=1246 /DNA_ORIENTATION=-
MQRDSVMYNYCANDLDLSVDLHIVMKGHQYKPNDHEYPHNTLRNVAVDLSNETASLLFLVDVDFIPNEDIYERLLSSRYTSKLMELKQQKKYLAIPSFEFTPDIHDPYAKTFGERGEILSLVEDFYNNMVPKTKSSLLELLATHVLEPCHLYYPRGSGPQLYDKYVLANSSYPAAYIRGFEPYVIIAKGFPRYDDRFISGRDKSSFFCELAAANYKAEVDSENALYHLPHDKEVKSGFERTKELFAEFVKEMKAKYNNDNCQNYGGVGREDEFVVRHNNKKRRYTLYELDVLELSFHYYREW